MIDYADFKIIIEIILSIVLITLGCFLYYRAENKKPPIFFEKNDVIYLTIYCMRRYVGEYVTFEFRKKNEKYRLVLSGLYLGLFIVSLIFCAFIFFIGYMFFISFDNGFYPFGGCFIMALFSFLLLNKNIIKAQIVFKKHMNKEKK